MTNREFDLEKHIGDLGDSPRFRLLSDDKLERIHEASLDLLENVGIKITTAAAVKLLTAAGCTVTGSDIVQIPRQVVEEAIESAPKRIVICDREGKERLFLEGRNTYFGLGITGLMFHDPRTGERRDFLLEDISLACRVADALPNLALIGTPGVTKETREIPQEIVNQHEFEAMVNNTTKPLTILVENASILGNIFEMAAVVAGGVEVLQERPFVISYLNNVSPLVYNAETLDKLLLSAEWGIPMLCIPAPMAGATAPVTLAGTIALGNAETLCGLVLSQLMNSGTPFIMGCDPALMDMQTGNISFAAPEQSLLMIAAAELAHYYGLPVTGLGCISDSIAIDQQTALEQMMSAYSCMLAGVHVVPYSGFIEVGVSFSLEAAVMADELIGMVKRIMKGVPVDEETLALDTIHSVGPGGNFMGEEHTLRHFRTEQWRPTLLSRTTFAAWEERGRKQMGDRVKEKLAEIIQSHQVNPLSDDVKAALSEIIEKRKRSFSEYVLA